MYRMVATKNTRITSPMAAHSPWLMRAEVSTPRRFITVNSSANATNQMGTGTSGIRSAMAFPHQMVQISGLSM